MANTVDGDSDSQKPKDYYDVHWGPMSSSTPTDRLCKNLQDQSIEAGGRLLWEQEQDMQQVGRSKTKVVEGAVARLVNEYFDRVGPGWFLLTVFAASLVECGVVVGIGYWLGVIK